MEKKFITKEQKEKVSNRLVSIFGILLAGALVMLYIYNFVAANYIRDVQNVLLVLSIIFFITTVLTFVLGIKKFPKVFKFWPISLGAFIACGIVASTKFIYDFPIKTARIHPHQMRQRKHTLGFLHQKQNLHHKTNKS